MISSNGLFVAVMGLGAPELIIILVILLVLFGGSKLPGLAKGLGQSIKEFKKSSKDDPEPERHITWARDFFHALQPHASGGVYLNFLGDEGRHRVRAAYGERTYERVARLKRIYDPTNLFRLNQNIQPG